MAHQLFIDLETYSNLDIGSCGAYRYAGSAAFEILLLAYGLDDQPVRVIDLAQGQQLPDWLIGALEDPGYVKHAYNAAFEITCLSRWLGRDLDPAQWRCTMIHGMYAGYPAGLAACGTAIGLPPEDQKLATGRALIQYFCKPCRPTKANGGRTRNRPEDNPERWDLFVEYNRRDVEAEQAIAARLAWCPVPDAVWRQWATDLRINRRGVGVDQDLVAGALAIGEAETGALTAEAARITGLANPNSRAQLLGWIRAHGHPDLGDIRAETVTDLLASETDPDVRRVLEIRQALGKTSTAKYDAMADCVGSDGRIRGLLQFYGAARTGRWAGRLVQVQNLPRTHLAAIDTARGLVKRQDGAGLAMLYGSTQDTLSQLIRTALAPAPGCVYVDADFSAIEARVIAWLAGEAWRLEVFRTTGKIYEASAAMIYGVPVETIAKGNPNYHLRQRGKVAELALGFQGGVGAMRRMDVSHALDEMDDAQVQEIVAQWRKASPAIPRLWRRLEDAAMAAIEGKITYMPTGTTALTVGREYHHATGADALYIQLPSGRRLYYASPAKADGEGCITYTGTSQTTGQWVRLETYGGKLTENVVQAIARDCLAEAIERLEASGHRVVFHVHDEVVVEMPRTGTDAEMLAEIVGIMRQPPTWARDLPLNADGWVGDYYTKD